MSNRLSNNPDFDPKTICYQPETDRPATTRTPRELRIGARALGITLEYIPGGYMATMETRNDLPSRVNVWDNKGRLVRTDFIGTVMVYDRTGPLAGEQSPIFSNVYEYSPDGMLARSSQVVTQNDLTTYRYRRFA